MSRRIEFCAPHPGISLLTLLMLALLVSLGFWQLDRAEQKRALLDRYQGQAADAPIQVREILQADAVLDYRPAQVKGEYDAGHQFLLDNRTHNGVAGYEVLTPLRIADGEHAILINRGWVPLGPTRDELPALPAPPGSLQLQGLLKRPAQPITLGEGEDREPGWPKVLQRVRLDLQAEQLGYPLQPMLLLLGPEEPGGFVREWAPVAGFGPERNTGYAVQWFSLATVLLLIYILVNSRRRRDGHEQ